MTLKNCGISRGLWYCYCLALEPTRAHLLTSFFKNNALQFLHLLYCNGTFLVIYGILVPPPKKKSLSWCHSWWINHITFNHFVVSKIFLAKTFVLCHGTSNVSLPDHDSLCCYLWYWICCLDTEDRDWQWGKGWWLLGLILTIGHAQQPNLDEMVTGPMMGMA